MADETPNAEHGVAAETAIGDTMDKVFDAIMARDEGGDDAGPDATDAPAETGGDVSETDTPAEQVAEGENTEGDETTDQGSDKGKETADAQPLEAPLSWSAEDKAKFAALPREAQEVIARRESERESFLSQKSQELAEVKRSFEAIDSVIGRERKEAWALQGVQPPQALTHLLALSDFATRDTGNFIRWFAQQHNIDLQQLAEGVPSVDPQIQAVHQRLNRYEQDHQARQAQEAERQALSVRQAVTDFAADTAHPHFKELEGEIALLLPGIKASNPTASPKEWLKTAYDKAVWSNDATRAKVIAERDKAAAAERQKQQKESAAKAKAAAGTNVRSKGSLPGGSEKARSIDETMSEAYDRIVGAA